MSLPAFFELPGRLEATEPPEVRGLDRAGVRLMVASRGQGTIRHARFHELPDLLEPGDLLVVNVSATLPAALSGTRGDGSEVCVHVATRAPHLDESWRVTEVRSPDGARPTRGRSGERITLDSGGEIELVAPYAAGVRLMLARFHGTGPIDAYLMRHGRPIRYGYVTGDWPLSAYQNVYATVPGSAEMPSAGRPFTPELITRLIARGILIAPVTLHCGVSSPERHEPPYPEYYEVPPVTGELVAHVHGRGGRVIAVGTTVVRALESAHSGQPSGWTGLVITPERGVHAVDGLITGWHEPEASHLELLEAIAGHDLLERSYREALENGYLWHEFGDSHLILAAGDTALGP